MGDAPHERVWWWKEPSWLSVTAQVDEWYDRRERTRMERPRTIMVGARVIVDGSPDDFEEARRYLEKAIRNTVAILTENVAIESDAYLYQFAPGAQLVILDRSRP